MIPLQLTLRNFMSYGDEPTTVDLRGMPVVCLSGDNGHGKSALLDAMTWALWGETRLGRQNHDQLIRLGADEMAVVLDFDVAGETYRVRRQRSKRSASQIWEIQAIEPNGTWRPLTGTGSGDTGRAIIQLLRMTYDTFLNSAYLRQGRADEFVRQTAGKRKEILAEILDLSRFDDLEAKARDKKSLCRDAAQDASRDIQQIDAELSQEQTVRKALETLLESGAEIDNRRAALSERVQELNQLRLTLVAQSEKLKDHEKQVLELDQQLKRIEGQRDVERRAADEMRRLINKKEQIENDARRYEVAQARIKPLREQAARFRELDRKRVELENNIVCERRELEVGRAQLLKQLSDLRRQIIELPKIAEQIASMETLTENYNALTTKRTNVWDGLKLRQGEFAELGADKKRLDAELAALQQRLENIDGQSETCSVCGSPLPPEKLDLLHTEVAATIDHIELERRRLIAKGIEAKREIGNAEADLKQIEVQLKELESSRDQLGGLQQRFSDLTARSEQVAGLEADIRAIEQDLRDEAFALDDRKQLAIITTEMGTIKDAEKQLDSVNAEIESLRGIEASLARLQSAERDLVSTIQRIADAEQSMEMLKKQRDSVAQSIAEAPQLHRQIDDNARELDQAKVALRDVDAEFQRAEREKGRLQQQVERFDTLRITRTKREADYQTAKNDEDLYTMLMGSFGKRGVQALIIENALPELQDDTNELLERLTDGEMSVLIQTTKQAKGRSAADAPIETLEIQISDHMGSRSLEMYSGGESFRVSFALRIALSKLLARRAGANLQTLIIDEGFGTQDGKGREKLVDAIMAIQSEFAQIIVITHVDELKEAFPNRIEVVKTPLGSELTVVTGAALG